MLPRVGRVIDFGRQVTHEAIVRLANSGRPSVNPNEARARLAERDARMAADDRTPAERWLNDPPRSQSALATSPFAPASRSERD